MGSATHCVHGVHKVAQTAERNARDRSSFVDHLRVAFAHIAARSPQSPRTHLAALEFPQSRLKPRALPVVARVSNQNWLWATVLDVSPGVAPAHCTSLQGLT